MRLLSLLNFIEYNKKKNNLEYSKEYNKEQLQFKS